MSKTHICEQEGCDSPDTMECILYGVGGEEDLVEWYCGEHATQNGYCWGCGHFWAGCEAFDFNEHNLCPNCRDNPDLVGYPEDLDDMEWLDAWGHYPAELLTGEVSGE